MMIPGKLYISVRQVSIGIWSMVGELALSENLIGVIEQGKPFIFIEFGEKEVTVGVDNKFYALKVLNHDGAIGFTSFLPLSIFIEAKEQ